uniref:Phospholipase n=1 Tax=Clandestinovirus TaxID=2831644 RepID=A0A8F8KRK4_9VIRU|nr:phospholipase [Clandestinovirus]
MPQTTTMLSQAIILFAITIPSFCGILPTILVPGIGGSVLYASKDKLPPTRVWLCYTQQDKYALEYLDSDYINGTTVSKKGYSIDNGVSYDNWKDGHLPPVDKLDTDLWFEGYKTYYYHNVIEAFKKSGYVPGVTLFGYPYDWRQHVCHDEIVTRFWKTIDLALTNANSSQVNIISHSMGGLVVQCALMHRPYRWKDIKNWVTIATPFRGAGIAVKSYMNGYDLGIGTSWVGGFSEQTSSKIMLNFASVPNLLPLTNNTGPTLSFNLNGQPTNVTGDQLLDTISKMTNLSSEFLESGQIWRHKMFRNRIEPPFTHMVIYSSSWLTKNDIVVKQPVTSIEQLRGVKNTDLEFGMVNGDGTVPEYSSTKPFFKKALLHQYKGWGDHVDMLKDDKLIQLLLDFIYI